VDCASEEDPPHEADINSAPLSSPTELIMQLSTDDIAELRETGLRQASPERPRAVTPPVSSPSPPHPGTKRAAPQTSRFSMCCGGRPSRDPPNEAAGSRSLAGETTKQPPAATLTVLGSPPEVSPFVFRSASPEHAGYDQWKEGTQGEPSPVAAAGKMQVGFPLYFCDFQ